MVVLLVHDRVSREKERKTRVLAPAPEISVADPDQTDPYVFGPPGSGSGSISQRYGSGSLSKNSKKTLIPTVL
jgi:hypothetical protein